MTHDEQAQVDNWFMSHALTADEAAKCGAVREAGKRLAEVIFAACPPSADRTAAVRKVREAVMTANASIACGGK
jgi:hypothetical protein